MNERANFGEACELRIDSGAELQQGGNAALMPDVAVRGLKRAGDDLQQSGFAAAVRPNDSGRGPRFNLETDVLQRPEFTVAFPEPARKHLLQAIARMVIHSILLGNAFNAERSVLVGLESVRSLKGYELSGGLSSKLKTKARAIG